MKSPFAEGLVFRRDATLKQYWKARLELHHFETYKGQRMAKMPEDLSTYEHVIWDTQPKVIVELGSGNGSSALWLADRLDIFCGGGTVVSVEKQGQINTDDPRITFIHGDLSTPAVVKRVSDLVGDADTMVIEDSRHDYVTTIAALRLYSNFVKKGQFFVVEDTIVDDEEMSIFGDHGVLPAVNDFLAQQQRFQRQALDFYGITMHSGGWLQAMENV